MENRYSVLDIKITEKKNMYGEIFEVDSLSPDELRMYIDCLVLFEGKKYMVSTVENVVYEKREMKTFKGKKAIA